MYNEKYSYNQDNKNIIVGMKNERGEKRIIGIAQFEKFNSKLIR